MVKKVDKNTKNIAKAQPIAKVQPIEKVKAVVTVAEPIVKVTQEKVKEVVVATTAKKTKKFMKPKKSSDELPESDIVEIKPKSDSTSTIEPSTTTVALESNADLTALYNTNLEIVKSKLKLKNSQVTEAITCLKSILDQKYKNSFDLLSRKEDEFMYLNFVFNKLPVRYSIRPTPIDIPSQIYGEKFNTRVCLIVKDPRSDFKDLNLTFPFQVKVLDLAKLKLKYSRFEERRNLIKEFDLFICDSRVYMVLKRFLGKPFFTSKKYPVPLAINYGEPEKIVSDITSLVCKNTAFYMTHGPNYTIKIARSEMTNEEIMKNVQNAAEVTIPHILKWGVDFNE